MTLLHSQMPSINAFDPVWYTAEYGSCLDAGRTPHDHYLDFGHRHGFAPRFDAEWYRREYLGNHLSTVDPYQHYSTYGRNSGFLPHFDEEFYAALYLKGKTVTEPYFHYETLGRPQGLFPGHSRSWYIKQYPDIAAAGVDPFQHFMDFGRYEDRRPSNTRRRDEFLNYQRVLASQTKIRLHEVRQPEMRCFYILADGATLDLSSSILSQPPTSSSYAPKARRLNSTWELTDLLESQPRTDWVLIVDTAFQLADDSLAEFSRAITAQPQVAIFYGDHDKVTKSGIRYEPAFKPMWNEEQFSASRYTDGAICVKAALIGQFREDFPHTIVPTTYELIRWARKTGRANIQHLQECVAHLHEYAIPSHEPLSEVTEEKISEKSATTTQMRSSSLEILIPSRRNSRDLLECVQTVAKMSPSWVSIAVAFSEPDQSDIEQLSSLMPGRFRHTYITGPFNYSRTNNLLAQSSRAEFLIFLNDDVRIIEAGWVEEILANLYKPEVGVVGCKLLYPNGTVQHAGVVLGLGGTAGHWHRGYESTDRGYLGYLSSKKECAAVTGACLAIRRQLFEEIGGFDEDSFPIAYNDVDLCIRVRERGLKVLCTPDVNIVHLESQTRGDDLSDNNRLRLEAEMNAFATKHPGIRDPFHNRNISLASERFEIALPIES